MQLVDDQVTIYDAMKDKRVDIRRSGGTVRGHGPTKWSIFLAADGRCLRQYSRRQRDRRKDGGGAHSPQFGSLTVLYAKFDEMKQPKRRETLTQGERVGLGPKSRACDRSRRRCPSRSTGKSLIIEGRKSPSYREQFFEEFRVSGHLLKRFDLQDGRARITTRDKYETVGTEGALKGEWCKELSKAPAYVAIDTETTSLRCILLNVVGISLSRRAAGLGLLHSSIGHHTAGNPTERARTVYYADQLRSRRIQRPLRGLLKIPEIPKVGQHLKYDPQILAGAGESN